MKDETRGAIVMLALAAAYGGAVYLRHARGKPVGEAITRALEREASDILRSDAIALVPETDDGIEVWPRGGARSESLPDRAALVAWLCSEQAPRETAVVMLRGIPLGRGKLDAASRDGRLSIEELREAPLPLRCPSRAKFFSLELRPAESR